MNIFFDKDDVRTVRLIPANIETVLFDALASEVEGFYIKKLLGNRMYVDLVSNSADDKYAKLITGGTYEYSGYSFAFDGLKLYGCYVFCYLFSGQASIKYANVGVSEFSQNDDSAQLVRDNSRDEETLYSRFKEVEEGIKAFITHNNTDYPLYGSYEPAEKKLNASWFVL
jgi:hypothetical protein